MVKRTGIYPQPRVDTTKIAAVGQAGGVLLTETVRATALDKHLTAGLGRWRKPSATHDPAKVVLDLAIILALGGDCLSDIAALRAEPGLYARVASDPTVSRTITALANDPVRVLRAISTARQQARAVAWGLAGEHAPDTGISAADPLVIDLDATLVTAHSEKEQAPATWKKGFGFHPLAAFLDHGPGGTGETLAIKLRAGNAESNTITDHITVTRQALAQLPGKNPRPGRKVLVRADSAGGTKGFLGWLARQRLSYSVGFTLPTAMPELYRLIPAEYWVPVLTPDGEPSETAGVAEITGLLGLDDGWPAGMRVILRRERPHPGAQLRFDDVDEYRLTAFATNTRQVPLPQLEWRHRRRARSEDRIRNAKASGLRNLPLKGFAQNEIWCQIVALATDLLAWHGLLAHPEHEARRWEPKRLRYRLFSIPATIARHGRHTILHLSGRSRWAEIIVAAVTTLRGLPAPAG